VAAGVQVVSSEKAASGILTLFGAPKSGAETPFLMTVSERSLLVGRGPRRAEVDYLGPGHTQGDLVVVVPDAGVLFCGDLAATGVLPFLRADDVDPEGWEKILQRLAGLKVGKLVPGHGAIGPTQGIADTAAVHRAGPPDRDEDRDVGGSRSRSGRRRSPTRATRSRTSRSLRITSRT
jgi:glyoxylase-like metal-dependent hydrolase (beta-lactamase superfamily II)